jgi:hypothetical protein
MPIGQSVRSKIADALLARIALLTDIKYSAFDVVKLQASDFQEFELPAVQIIDLGEINTHEMRRGKKSWNLVIEVIVGDTQLDETNQKELWDLMQAIEEHIFQDPKLGLSEVIQMNLVTSSTDMHLLKPFYLGRIEVMIDYYQPITGQC